MSMGKRRGFWVLGVLALGAFTNATVRGGQEPESQPKPKAEQPAAAASAMEVDTARSRVYIKVGSTTRLGHVHGVQGQLASGKITLGGPGQLVFAMQTFASDTAEARRYVGLTGSISASDQQKTTANMLSSDVLDVGRYPTASYTIRTARPADGQAPGAPGRYQLDGDFMLHGVARRVPLLAVVEPSQTAGALRMRTSFTIYQSHYSITPYSALGGLVGVTDRLDIWGDVLLHPAAQ